MTTLLNILDRALVQLLDLVGEEERHKVMYKTCIYSVYCIIAESTSDDDDNVVAPIATHASQRGRKAQRNITRCPKIHFGHYYILIIIIS